MHVHVNLLTCVHTVHVHVYLHVKTCSSFTDIHVHVVVDRCRCVEMCLENHKHYATPDPMPKP